MEFNYFCERFRDKLPLYLDNELPLQEAQLIERHLKSCIGCRVELKKLHEVDKFGKMEAFPDPGNLFFNNQRRQILNKIGEKEQPGYNIKHLGKRRLSRPGFSFGSRMAIGLSAAAVIIFSVVINFDSIISLTDRSDYFPNTNFVDRLNVINSTARNYNDFPQDNPDTIINPGTISDAGINPTEPVIEPDIIVEPINEDLSESIPLKAEDIYDLPGNRNITAGDERIENEETRSQMSIDDFSRNTLGDLRTSSLNTNPNALYNSQMINEFSSSFPQTSFSDMFSKNFSKDEEFDAYISTKEILIGLDNPIEQKVCLLTFLPSIKDKKVKNLVINDLFDIYYKIIQDKEIGLSQKKEALKFLEKYEEEMKNIFGDSYYSKQINYFIQQIILASHNKDVKLK
ncbi:zf-HC2 domain-containing protein [candidate division KSB1 bacterium]